MKKFFKILMVLALLSGAALSCTKDYSKEIADVQKQNQELDGLIAALQTALNSTNTTVSQISALTGKNEADIAALVSANAEAFAEIVSSHANDVEYLEELIAALEAAGVKQGEEIYAAIDALKAAQAKALADAIIDLEGKIADGDDAAAKVAADALAAAVEKLEKAITDGDAATAKAAADALAEAQKALKAEIADGDKAVADAAAKALEEAKTALGGKIEELEKALAAEIARATAKEDELANEFATQIAALATKTDADIAKINAALESKADKSDVEQKYVTLNEQITTLQGGLIAAQADINKLITDFEAHNKDYNDLKSYVEENFKIKAEAIAAAEGRLDKLEAMLADYPEIKALVATNKQNIADNAAAIKELQEKTEATQKQVDDLTVQVEANKIACDAAIEEINKAIKTLQEQVEVLSARLTNIVAAPAKNVECLSVTIGDSTFVNLQMDFKVAPASFAKTIADGFKPGNEGDVKVVLNLTSGYTRTKANESPMDIDFNVVPFKVVNTKEGIISVTANLSGIEKSRETKSGEAHMGPVIDGPIPSPFTSRISPYVSIIVSGTDYEGLTYERISEPVAPIRGSINEGDDILEALAWHKGDSLLFNLDWINDLATNVIKCAKKIKEDEDFAFADGRKLYVALADLDWKSYKEYNNENVIKDYELKIPAEVNPLSDKPISLNEIAEMLDVNYDEVFAPYFVKVKGQTLSSYVYEQIEWENFPESRELKPVDAAFGLFSSSNPKALEIKLGVKKLPEGKDTDKAEFVGAWYKVASNDIAFGEVETSPGYNVVVYQRIGKHVSRTEVTEPLYVPFAYNAGVEVEDLFGAPAVPPAIADHSNKKFTAVAWKGQTDIARHKTRPGYLFEEGATSYNEETVVKYQSEPSKAWITPTSSQTKFADIQLLNVPFQAKEKKYQFVWMFEPYKNSYDVQAEDYLDYINVTVAPYHKTVPVKLSSGITKYLSMTQATTVETPIVIKDVLGKDESWFDPMKFTDANQSAWIEWYSERYGDETGTIYADTLGKRVLGYWAKDNVSLSWINNKLCVTFEPVPVNFDVDTYNVHAVDTIDNVIAFDYFIPITPLPVGATIATRGGFVQDGTVTVKGAVSSQADGYKYIIPDINLDNYFQFANLGLIHPADVEYLGVNFTSKKDPKAKGDIVIDDSYSEIGNISGTNALLEDQCKVSWGNYTGTEFTISAQTLVGDTKISKPVDVKFVTADPIKNGKIVEPKHKVKFIPSKEQKISVLKKNPANAEFPESNTLSIIPEGYAEIISTASNPGILKSFSAINPDFGFTNKYPTAVTGKLTCKVGGETFESSTLIESCGWNDTYTDFVLVTKPHDAIGKIEITIPFEWNYRFGKLEFNATIVIE